MNFWLTTLIIVLAYLGIAIGGFPGWRVNRTTIALIGVGALLGLGLLRFDQLSGLLEINTLVLLFGMMIINANLQLAGFFRLAGAAILKVTRTPRTLLALEILLAGFLSALFLNDTICLMLTPLVLDVTSVAKRNPLPYLIALAAAANIGSAATFTGNPQNMIIGLASGLTYLQFTSALAPLALLGLGTVWVTLVLFYPQEFRPGAFPPASLPTPYIFRPLLFKSLVVTAGLLTAFILGVPIAEAAFVAGTILLFTRRVRPEKVMHEIDWNLLVFFTALFILTGVIELNRLTEGLFTFLAPFLSRGAVPLTLITVLLSNLVSNVPAVLLLRPAVSHLTNPQAGWLTLAAASTLAGNFTLLGSVANLIVAESAARRGVSLRFSEYTKSGLVISLLSLFFGVLWLQWMVW